MSYLLGHSKMERDRLIEQAGYLDGLTASLFREAGIRPGMTVLDAGCGVGDTSFLAASIVGADGRVIGVDRSADAIACARQRAANAGVANVHFLEDALDDVTLEEPVDAIVGRLVLLYLPDAAATLRRLARHLRPGGVIAFQDVDGLSGHSEPTCPLYELTLDRLRQAFARSNINISTGTRLPRIFKDAGFAAPRLQVSTIAEHGDTAGACRWTSELTRTVLPAMEMTGVATAAEVDVDTLSDRMQREARERDATVVLFSFVGAWARA